MNSYKLSMIAQAQALRRSGWSQTEIGRELGVGQRAISRWLKLDILTNGGGISQNGLSVRPPVRYLVVRGLVEEFRPPEGVTFPLIIADPPWNISDVGHKRERKARPNRPFTKDFGAWDAFPSEGDYLTKCREWLQALYEVADPDAFLFFWCSYTYMSHILRLAQRAGWKEKNIFAWAKANPMPMFGNNNTLASLELALILAKGAPIFQFKGKAPLNWFGSPQVGGLERVKNRHDGAAANLAQKPLDLTSLWVLWGSRPGDWILDAFAGTGTATVAALQHGRNACAVETDPTLIPIIEQRVQEQCPGAIAYA